MFEIHTCYYTWVTPVLPHMLRPVFQSQETHAGYRVTHVLLHMSYTHITTRVAITRDLRKTASDTHVSTHISIMRDLWKIQRDTHITTRVTRHVAITRDLRKLESGTHVDTYFNHTRPTKDTAWHPHYDTSTVTNITHSRSMKEIYWLPMNRQLHFLFHSIVSSNLNLLGLFSTERGKRDLEN